MATILILAPVPGCATRLRSGPDPSRRGSPLEASTLPEWVGESVTWQKLDTLEGWLKTEGERADPFWRVEAELQLAEGRLEFASEPGRVDEITRRQRRRNARSGFLRIRSDSQASDSQVRRASAGLARAEPGGLREAAAPSVQGVLARSLWDARRANPERLTRATSPWSFLTIHHSALEGAGPIGTSQGAAAEAIRMVQHSHMDGRKFGDVGYHFLIDPAGRVWQGRELVWQGAHAGGKDGRNNVGNMGICLLGNFDHAKPTDKALRALERLIKELSRTYRIPRGSIVAHSDWKGTACPGRYLLPHVRRLAR